jgi:hypothetical protein
MKTLLTFAGLVVAVAVASPASATAAQPLTAHQDPAVGQLLVPGDRVEIGYHLDSGKATAASLYVRSDREGRFQRLQLTRKGRTVSTVLPARLLRGHRLFYYAVIHAGGRSLTTAKQAAWILQKPTVVRLGQHRFGHTRAADAVVARASADEVGWDTGELNLGPQTFNVAPDGSVWLQDSYRNRLLVWNHGQPDRVARVVALPGFAGAGDFAFGPGGTIYASAPGLLGYDPLVYRLSPTGDVLWSARLPAVLKGVGQLALRVGPSGTVDCAVNWTEFGRENGDHGWMPVATAGGRPISISGQRRRALWGYEPLAGGLRLVSAVYTPPHSQRGPLDVRYAIVDSRGRIVRAWRILSRTQIYPGGPPFFTPELVGGDPVVDLDVARPGQVEHVVLRLGPHGTPARFSVGVALFGAGTSYADMRVGPDGRLYQLVTSATTGVEIRRYRLG